MNKYKISLISLVSLILPIAVYAIPLQQFLETGLKPILNSIVQVLVVLAVFILIFGIFSYITSGGDEEKVKKGRQFIMYGLIGIVLMLTINAIINILVDTILGTGNLSGENTTPIPRPL